VEAWRTVFRVGVELKRDDGSYLLPTRGLEALARALEEDSPQLLQGATTTPPPLKSVEDWPCEGACGLAFIGWQGNDLKTVIEVEEFFTRTCSLVDAAAAEPATCRWFLNAYDDWSRDEMRANLLPEVQLALAGREGAA
jgi:hypothetical protein